MVSPPGIPAQSAIGVEKEFISKHPLNGLRSSSHAERVTLLPVNELIPDTTKSDIVTATSSPGPLYSEFNTNSAKRFPSLPPSPGYPAGIEFTPLISKPITTPLLPGLV